MRVRICWRDDNACESIHVSKNRFSMSEAKLRVKPLVADEQIADVWVEYWPKGMYRWTCHKKYKEKGKKL